MGIVQPIVVEPVADGRYCILAGERRHAACRHLGLEVIPCVVRTADTQSRLELQLIENLQRKDLHPVEEAHAFKRLMEEFNLTQRDLARRLGRSLSSINETLRILGINPELMEHVRTSEHCNKSVLLEIAKETDPQQQQVLWQKAQAGQLPVSQARKQRGGDTATKSRKATFTLELAEARVLIKFTSGESSPPRVREVLEAALKLQSDNRQWFGR
jgi:ParB family transcriptional regulator, chromosome partitioning protein